MILFLTVSAALSGVALWQGRVDAPKLQPVPVITGRWTPSYEKIFNKKLYTYNASTDGWGALNYAAFREGNKGVLVGKDGWLFTSEEFDHQKDQGQNFENNLDYIHAVHDYLAAKNITLVIVPVPAKARVYRDELGRYNFPSYKENVYQSFLQDMAAHKIYAVDTMRAMSVNKPNRQLFLKTDTHWTPEGAQTAAYATAQYVAQSVPVTFDKTGYICMPKETGVHKGDLLRYIPAGYFSTALKLPEDKLNTFETVENGIEPAAGENNMSDALFSDKTPPVTLVGTSYSANPKWNFENFLKENLGTDVLNAADEGLGPFETMQKYLKNSAFRDTPPKLVLWEMPERYLSFKYDLKTDFAMDGA
jgi:alginate O-acetyltransferase complex protein AlgJ